MNRLVIFNQIKNKEQLFLEALSLARKIWRKRNLVGVEEIVRPADKIKRILANYKDRYLVDSDSFPGACVVYTSDKSTQHLDFTIGALISYLDNICE